MIGRCANKLMKCKQTEEIQTDLEELSLDEMKDMIEAETLHLPDVRFTTKFSQET